MGLTRFGETSVGGGLVVNSGGDVTQTGPLVVTDSVSITAPGQTVILDNVGNSSPGGAFAVTADRAVIVGDFRNAAEEVASAASSSGVVIDMRSALFTGVSSMAAVSLPKGTATAGAGFSFELPDSVRATAQQASDTSRPQAALPNGAPLPGWLKFDPERMRFFADAVPDGAFPIQVAVTLGQQRVLVVISERTE